MSETLGDLLKQAMKYKDQVMSQLGSTMEFHKGCLLPLLFCV